MWALRSVVALAVSASLVAALPSYDSPFKVKETVAPPRNWVKHSAPPPDHTIVLRIGLPQPNFDILEEHLYEISDPDHARYAEHLTKEQVEELVSPHPDNVDAVNKWLYSHGIAEADLSRTPAQDWVTVRVPVRLAEKMLDTTYHIWQHTEDGDYLVRTTSYSLPEELLGHVDLIQPTTMFGRFKGAKSTVVWDDDSTFQVAAGSAQSLEPIVDALSGVTIDPTCNTTITVSCLKQLYNAVGYVPSAKGNSIGLTGYLEEYANLQDLQSFYKDQVPDAVNSSFEFISVHGGLNNQSLDAAGGEANLDVQFALGISHPVPGTFYSTAGRPPFTPSVRTPSNTNEPYTDWLDFVLAHPNPPLTISTSYGDDEQTVPKSFAERACKGFAQLGARGVSVIFSSGDFGVGDGNPNPATQQCFTNNGANVTRFIPAFPASCPFVTSVGGTQNINPEVAVSRFFSGGGFSDYFKRPAYQDQHVGEFLNGLPKGLYKGLFNRGGRGIPDVAAQGDRFRIFLSGVPRSIGGTSASAPTFAGIVALLNDARLKSHKRSLGFLNPLLYKKGFEGLNDIVSGKNPGCGTQGFNATKGWDPVTGLGTPNFGKLKEIVLKA